MGETIKRKNKQYSILTALEEIISDVSCNDIRGVEKLLTFLPIENLIAALPKEKWKQFKHLRNDNRTK